MGELLLGPLSLSLLVAVLEVTDGDVSVALLMWTVGAVVGLNNGGGDGDVVGREGLLGIRVAAVDEKVAGGAVVFVRGTATVRSRTEYRVCIKVIWIG